MSDAFDETWEIYQKMPGADSESGDDAQDQSKKAA